jgi:hypothetical protein
LRVTGLTTANFANGEGKILMLLDTGATVLPQASVAVQVSVTVPPQGPGRAVKVDKSEVPLTRQLPVNPLVKVNLEAAGIVPQASSMAAGAFMTGRAAGNTVMTLDTGASNLPHPSVARQVSVTVPPQAPGSVDKVERSD